MKNRASLILRLSLLASMSLSVGICVSGVEYAMANEGVVRESAMTVDGFSVRVNVSPDDQTGEGVRFHIGMTTDLYNSLLNNEKTAFKDGVSTGTVIIPTALKSGDLTKDTAKATVEDTSNAWFEVKDENQQVIGMQSVVYLWDIPSANYGNDISVVGYINDNGTIKYSEEESRSMSWVAKEEYNDSESKFDATMKAELKSKYIDKKVTFNNDGDSSETVVEYGQTLSVSEPTKQGYTFDGWFNKTGTAKWDMTTQVTNPINLYAQWTRNTGYEDFLWLDENNTDNYVVSERGKTAALTQVTKEIVDGSTIGEQGNVLKLKLMKNTNMCFHIPNVTSEKLNNFDYYTVVGYADCTRTGFRVASYDKNATYLESEKLTDIKGKFEYKVKKDYFNEYLQFVIANQTGSGSDAMQYLYIISITGGYDSVETGAQLNLVEKTGFTAAELAGTYFENASGEQTVISDLTAFTPAQIGKIVLELNVKGYAQSELEMEVVAPLPIYNDLLLLGENDVTNYIVTEREKGVANEYNGVTKEIVDGAAIGVDGKVLKVDTSTVSNANLRFHMPNVATDKLNNFDYYTIVGYVDCNRAGFRVSAAKSTTEEVGTNSGLRMTDIKGSFTYKVDKEYFVGDHLQFIFADWTGTNSERAKGLYLISITGGYNSVEAGTQLNLVEKTGFTAAELAGTYFENASGAQTVVSDLTAFTPTEAGTIVLICNKEGYRKANVTIQVTTTV